METENGSNLSTTNPLSCNDHKMNLTSGLQSYRIIALLTPVDSRLWTDRDAGWMAVFKVYIVLLGSIYLLLGLMSVVLLIKKDCVRLAAKTFFAVYSTIAILGFSRALLLALDPYNLLGFISERFPQWIIVSRILGSFGFPSLVASYTLMVLTLLKISNANPGKQWYHQWRFVVPIVILPYIIAVGAEVIGYTVEYPGLLAVIICDAFFSLWGVTICITYMIAGGRLMYRLKKTERKMVRMHSSSSNRSPEEQSDFASQEYERHHKHNRRTLRKIAIITYGTVFVALLYSLFTIGNVIMVSLFLYDNCLSFMGIKGDSTAWLILHILTRTTETVLAVIMLYSITDIQGVVKFISRMFTAVCCCKRMRVTECSGQTDLHQLATGRTLRDNATASQMNGLARSHDEAAMSTDNLINATSNNTITTTTTMGYPATNADTRTEVTSEHSDDDDDVFDSRDSAIQLEATANGQKESPSINNPSLNPNVPRTFLLNASQGESSSSIESCTPTTTLQEVSQPLLSQTSKHSTAAPDSTSLSRTILETTEKRVQEQMHAESLQQTEVEKQQCSALIDSSSPDHNVERAQTAMPIETETQVVEQRDGAHATEATRRGDKPVPKPRRFAPTRTCDQEQSPITSNTRCKQTV